MTTPGSKYLRTISGKKEITLPDGRKEVMRVEVQVDIYDVINAWNLTDPALQHALKKLIQPGQRGNKTRSQDLQEAIYSIERCLENTRPECVPLHESLNILAAVAPPMPKMPQMRKHELPPAPTGPGPAVPELIKTVAPDYFIQEGSAVRRRAGTRDGFWAGFCTAHKVPVDAIFVVNSVDRGKGTVFLDVEDGKEWNIKKFELV
ncbi:hypothetical protein QJS83_14785 [Bdellovibrio sp. 22V]|uniref:hypothetical protein n=1 Tax=Bdellovibrio sp. 22V TaxID=3044166 RepID=UPI0025427C0E|nr:hypothetical protein [Bdellovibrio sp. 22V]WII71729.1 hypothetical protein QJS83_14785 [Bdellovibrio sp. 22V]